MPSDFPDLVRSLLRGLAGGSAVLVVVLLWRAFQGQPLWPKRSRVSDVPLSVWLMGTLFFGAAAVGSALASLPSFTIVFSLVTLLYMGGLASNRLR